MTLLGLVGGAIYGMMALRPAYESRAAVLVQAISDDSSVVEGGDHFGDGGQLGLEPVDLALDAFGLGQIVLDLGPLLPLDGIDELEFEPADGVPYEILVESVHGRGVPLRGDADTRPAAAVPGSAYAGCPTGRADS